MERRFEQPALHLYDSIQKVLLNSFQEIRSEDDSIEVIERICDHFGDDIDKPALIRQLGCLQDARKALIHTDRAATAVTAEPANGLRAATETITSLIACTRKLGHYHTMFHEVANLLQLFLLMPVTSATAERSFSGLRRLKTFLRTSMSQELLNSIAILHVHKELSREVNIDSAAKEFVARSDHRLSAFGSFPS
jgi:hypothetical protein